MARIRSIKPEFWDDRKLARRTSRDARLLYIALWNMADEHGRLNGDPRWVRGQAFPYEEDLDDALLAGMLGELQDAEVVVAYEADGDPYLYLPKLAKHQRLEPGKVASKIPAPPVHNFSTTSALQVPDSDGDATEGTADGERLVTGNRNTRPDQQEQLRANESAPRADSSEPDDDSSALLYVAGSMEHGAWSRGAARGPDRAGPDPRPTRPPDASGLHELPGDFKPTDAMRRWANSTYPGLDLDFETKQFCHHFRSEGKRKKSWVDAWQKWIGDSHKRMTQATARASPARASTTDQRVAQAEALKAELAEARKGESP